MPGADKHRYYQSEVINGVSETTVYVGGYEAVTSNGSTTFRHHLMADGREVAEIDLSNSGSTVVEKISYILSDHLGSVDVVTNASGGVTADMSFGAFGNRREPGTWLPPVGSTETQNDHNADRYGFTHQEMLDNVSLIHMSGRVYDPALGRFLSVDPVFEFPTNTQSLNPYSYVLNNPLSMTDPTGYVSTCGTGKTSCPDGMKPGDTAEKTFTPTGSHIAIHITATVQANGDVAISSNNTQVAQSISGAAAKMFGGDNGAQNSSQGLGTGQVLGNSTSQGADLAPGRSGNVAQANAATGSQAQNALQFLQRDNQKAGQLTCTSNCYASDVKAETAAANRYLAPALLTQREVTWLVFKLPDKSFSYTYGALSAFRAVQQALPPIKYNYDLMSAGHIHWDSNHEFSPQDWLLITQGQRHGPLGITLYLGAADRRLQFATPDYARQFGENRGALFLPPSNNFPGITVPGVTLKDSFP